MIDPNDMSSIDVNYVNDLEEPEVYQEKAAIFAELWGWVEKNINRTNVLKGWTTKERRDGEYVALIHAELSEALEAMRMGNPNSDNVPDISHVEEELADALIRIMDLAYNRKWNLPRALFLKMEFNKKRPYKHGGKLF